MKWKIQLPCARYCAQSEGAPTVWMYATADRRNKEELKHKELRY